MEQGDRSHNQVGSGAVNGANAVPTRIVIRLSSRKRRNRRSRRESCKKPAFAMHDHNSEGYEWLQPGWIVEEYLTKSGRTYKRYFDEWDRPYNTKREVLNHYAECDRIYKDEDDDGGEE